MEKVESVKKLNMDDYLFHGISAYFYDGYSSKIEEESEIFRTILNTKFIGSRKYLEKILENDKRERLELVRSVRYYVKENSVSIYFTRYSNIKDFSSYYSGSYWDNNPFFAYYAYKNKPSIILNAKLLENLPCIYSKWGMPGEIQIQDKIPIDYFVGIALSNINLNSSIDRAIESTDTTTKNTSWYLDLMHLSEEEFVNKYYQDVILFERVLKETGYSLKLYHTETGEEIMSQNDEIEHIKVLKEKAKIIDS